jgi:hypothetical protein
MSLTHSDELNRLQIELDRQSNLKRMEVSGLSFASRATQYPVLVCVVHMTLPLLLMAFTVMLAINQSTSCKYPSLLRSSAIRSWTRILPRHAKNRVEAWYFFPLILKHVLYSISLRISSFFHSLICHFSGRWVRSKGSFPPSSRVIYPLSALVKRVTNLHAPCRRALLYFRRAPARPRGN